MRIEHIANLPDNYKIMNKAFAITGSDLTTVVAMQAQSNVETIVLAVGGSGFGNYNGVFLRVEGVLVYQNSEGAGMGNIHPYCIVVEPGEVLLIGHRTGASLTAHCNIWYTTL